MIKFKKHKNYVKFSWSNTDFKVYEFENITLDGKVIIKFNPKKYKYMDLYKYLYLHDHYSIAGFSINFDYYDKSYFQKDMFLLGKCITYDDWDGYLYLGFLGEQKTLRELIYKLS